MNAVGVRSSMKTTPSAPMTKVAAMIHQRWASQRTKPEYLCVAHSKPSLNSTKGLKVVLCGLLRNTAHSAGDSVSEFTMLSAMLKAMVRANWLYS